jgi:hypothetical protein
MPSEATLPQLYLVPCTCGKTVRVRARQAGEQVTCACGAAVNVPTIRGLKQLQTVVDETEKPTQQRSSWQGPLFSFGLIAIFIGTLILLFAWLFPPAGLNFDWRNLAMNAQDAQRGATPVADLGISDLYDEFLMLRDRTRATPWDQARDQAEAAQTYQRNRHLTGGILVGVGSLLTIIGLALPALSSRRS